MRTRSDPDEVCHDIRQRRLLDGIKAMRAIDLRVPALAGLAVLLLAFAPGAKAADTDIQFAAGTGEPAGNSPALPYSDDHNEGPNAEQKLNKLSRDLANPVMQDGVAAMVEQIGESMLDLPVGQFATAIERARPGTVRRHIDDDTTVADLAGRDADDLPRALGQGTRQMMAMLSAFAGAFATMAPQFEQMGRDLDRSMRDIRAPRD